MAESKIVGHSQDVKARPILMSAPMVKASLRDDDPKSQTRRICKNHIYGNGFKFVGDDYLCHNDYLPPSAMLMDVGKGKNRYVTSSLEGWEESCPYGRPGDLLYVRESICVLYEEGESYDPMGGAGAEMGAAHGISYGMARTASIPYLAYAADGDYLLEPPEGKEDLQMRSCPSIHMPRWAARRW